MLYHREHEQEMTDWQCDIIESNLEDLNETANVREVLENAGRATLDPRLFGREEELVFHK